MIEPIKIESYNYTLPESRIASYPLPERDASRLLRYGRGVISDHSFAELPRLIPTGTLMVFNNSRVLPARLFFSKDNGAVIEILCLEPIAPKEYNLSFASIQSVVWRVLIGNKKRWKGGKISLYNPQNQELISSISLFAEYVDYEEDTSIDKMVDASCVRFFWSGNHSFSHILELCGQVPIPPYLNRKSEDIDIERYQTIYAHNRGSVAAPTAGLHFSESTLSSLQRNHIDFSEISLHVGAGTFLPLKTSLIARHEMHSEPFTVSKSFLEKLLTHMGEVVAVGTTSARCIESLYWLGLMCFLGEEPFFLPQWYPYSAKPVLSKEASLEQLLSYLNKNQLDNFSARTQVMIVPSFIFHFVNGLITNFHQPKSTLLLLIAAFIGEDWRRCYAHALAHGYRFLSYGDSSLLLPKKSLPSQIIFT